MVKTEKEITENLIRKAKLRIEKGDPSEGKMLFKRLAESLSRRGKDSEARRILIDAGDLLKSKNYWSASQDMYELARNDEAIAKLWDYVSTRFGEVKTGNRIYEVTEEDRIGAYKLSGDAYSRLGQTEKAEARYARAS